MPRKKRFIEFAIDNSKKIDITCLNEQQIKAVENYKNNYVSFFLGCAGTGKSYLAMALAIQEIQERTKEKIYLARPTVEAGETLGFLPGNMSKKVHHYMVPLYDCLDKICDYNEALRESIWRKIELAPLNFLRGRTLDNGVAILDESQNTCKGQLKLFLTRLGNNSKMIITGDPTQSDLGKLSELLEVVKKLEGLPGIGITYFTEESVVRHPLVAQIIQRLT